LAKSVSRLVKSYCPDWYCWGLIIVSQAVLCF
jgi:hypothetical protein